MNQHQDTMFARKAGKVTVCLYHVPYFGTCILVGILLCRLLYIYCILDNYSCKSMYAYSM